MSVDVRHDEPGKRFVAAVEGHEVTLRYALPDEHTADFLSTFTPPELRGRGLAKHVVAAALAWARGQGREVIPSCWYVQQYLQKEKESK